MTVKDLGTKRLETERLILRRFTLEDAEKMYGAPMPVTAVPDKGTELRLLLRPEKKLYAFSYLSYSFYCLTARLPKTLSCCTAYCTSIP